VTGGTLAGAGLRVLRAGNQSASLRTSDQKIDRICGDSPSARHKEAPGGLQSGNSASYRAGGMFFLPTR
jgi:hypothetical protein